MNKVLILGASGFIGKTIYRELHSYFNVFGTYCRPNKYFNQNKVLFQYDVEQDSILPILEKVQPNFIISSLRGDFKAQINAHKEIASYVTLHPECKLLYLSTVNVFDAKFNYPSYEYDTLLADSEYGRAKVAIEKIVMNLDKNQLAILRLPMVLGINSPRLIQLKKAFEHKTEFDVYPNLIISVTTANKLAQQIHYIINQQLVGIYHLASENVIHHSDVFKELAELIELEDVIFKHIYHSNTERYLAILAKENILPKHLHITTEEVIKECIITKEEKNHLLDTYVYFN